MKRLITVITFLLVILGIPFSYIHAQDVPAQRFEGVVSRIGEEGETGTDGQKQKFQNLEIEATSGELTGEKIFINIGNIPVVNVRSYKVGDQVVISASQNLEGQPVYYVTDYVRRTPLYILFGIFVGLTLLIGKFRGLSSLLGMGFSFLVIFVFILPGISAGNDPVIIAILASLIIIPVTFFLTHGINKKTIPAVFGTFIALVITGVLAGIFVDAARFTGFSSEEASFLQASRPGEINIKGLLLAGIIIGVLGILDDITISQSSIVQQLKKTSPNMKLKELYSNAMEIGRDHIASVVNTLVLVYTGAALPLLLLFINNPAPFSEVINYEFIAEEILRTLVSSIGLILAVPVTTVISAFFATRKKNHLI